MQLRSTRDTNHVCEELHMIIKALVPIFDEATAIQARICVPV